MCIQECPWTSWTSNGDKAHKPCNLQLDILQLLEVAITDYHCPKPYASPKCPYKLMNVHVPSCSGMNTLWPPPNKKDSNRNRRVRVCRIYPLWKLCSWIPKTQHADFALSFPKVFFQQNMNLLKVYLLLKMGWCQWLNLNFPLIFQVGNCHLPKKTHRIHFHPRIEKHSHLPTLIPSRNGNSPDFTLERQNVWRCLELSHGGFLKWWLPQITHLNRVFHYFHHPFWGSTI